jgi:hypothetical protein
LHAVGSGKDVPQRVTTSLALFKEEKRRRDEAAVLMAGREATLAALSARREEVADAAARVQERERDLDRTRQRVEGRLASIELERRSSAVKLVGAQEAEERLEKLWGTVTQGDAFRSGHPPAAGQAALAAFSAASAPGLRLTATRNTVP